LAQAGDRDADRFSNLEGVATGLLRPGAAGVVRISVEGAPSEPTALARALSEALGVEAWVSRSRDIAGPGGPAVRRRRGTAPGEELPPKGQSA